MALLDKLEKKLHGVAVPNLTLYLIIGQALVFVLSLTRQLPFDRVLLIPEYVLAGEYWRLLTFLFVPPTRDPLFIIFAWYLFYLMGNALEAHWGTFRYNVFLLLGYGLAVAVSFLTPTYPSSNAFIAGSVFLAFAFLFPDFTLMIFFILPVRIKWLALITWLGYGWQLLVGSNSTRLLVLASVGNFLLVFGSDLLWLLKNGRRRMASQARQIVKKDEPFHRCTVCGITDQSHPQMDFRYCPQCEGQFGYCRDHIFSHAHVQNAGNKG